MRAGRVKISEELFLKWLQFPNAKIREVKFIAESEVLKIGILEFVVEDGEMPEIKEGEAIPDVIPRYTRYTDGMGNSVAIREPLNK